MPAWRMKWRARGLERTSLKTRHYAEKTTPEWIARAYGTNELDIECIVVTTQEPHRTPALPGNPKLGAYGVRSQAGGGPAGHEIIVP